MSSITKEKSFFPNRTGLKEVCQKFVDEGTSPALGFCVADTQEDRMLFTYHGGSEKPGGVGTKVTEDTLMHVASVSKIITATLIGLLIERGFLTLSTPLKSFFPDCTHEDITIYHMLTHTTGYPVSPDISILLTHEEKDKLHERVFALERDFKAGEMMVYSNYFYTFLGIIIERYSGMDLNEFARREIFLPLGMENTFYGAMNAEKNGNEMINFYSHIKGDIMPEYLVDIPRGDCSVVTKAQELVRFGQMFLNRGVYGGKRILSGATVDMLCRECTDGVFNRTPAFFTKGNKQNNSIIPDNASPRAVAHHGMTGSILFIDPEYKICAALTGNGERMHQDINNYKRLLAAAITLSDMA
ncbi:MAG: serine hydrolase domain-containing protein [Saccharofermentanales bacterium]